MSKKENEAQVGPLTKSEFDLLIKLAKKVLWSDLETRELIQQHKLNITPANFYSNIPSVAEVRESFEYREAEQQTGSYFSETIFSRERTENFLTDLQEYAKEFDPPLEKPANNDRAFYWNNSSFSYMDAMSYYCIIRHFKPKRILEIGAGNSTLVANQALEANGLGDLVLIEPHPPEYLKNLELVSKTYKKIIQDFELKDLIPIVEEADILFIDSTHTVKVGSDCLFIYLKLMPEITKKMLVHAHDIALPYAQPQSKIKNHIYWTEQYLLYAYLLDNPKARALAGSYFSQREFPEISKELMGGKYADGGGSFWFELN